MERKPTLITWVYIYRHNFLRFGVWVKVYPPEKGFFGGEIKKMGLGFLRGKRNEITQFLKSDSNYTSIYRRKLKRVDANNMSIYIHRHNFLSFNFLNREDRTDAYNMSIYTYRHNFLRFGFFKSWRLIMEREPTLITWVYIYTDTTFFVLLFGGRWTPRKGFLWWREKKMGLVFLRGERNEITQFWKSDSNNMSIYRRKLKTADSNNMSIYRRKLIPWVLIEENRRL